MDAWTKLHDKRQRSLAQHWHNEALSIARAIQQAENGLTWGQAMREAERIVMRRRLQDGSL